MKVISAVPHAAAFDSVVVLGAFPSLLLVREGAIQEQY